MFLCEHPPAWGSLTALLHPRNANYMYPPPCLHILLMTCEFTVSPPPTACLKLEPLMRFDKSRPTCLWKRFNVLVFLHSPFLPCIEKPFLLKCHFSLKADGQKEGGGCTSHCMTVKRSHFIALIQWGLHSITDRQHLLSQNTNLMLALSLDNPRSQFVKIKWLHFKTKSPPTSNPGPSQLSVSTGQWVVWRSFYHGCPALVTDGPLQRSSRLMSNPICYHLQHTGPQMSTQDSSNVSVFWFFFSPFSPSH